VLFVDDELSILMMRRLVFQALGYSVFTAASGEDALKVCAMSSGQNIHPHQTEVGDWPRFKKI
jgi:CheY-like chemotaxis protein